MKWTVTGYYWDGKNHYVIYENKNGNTKLILEKQNEMG
jgi:hypothetical protein